MTAAATPYVPDYFDALQRGSLQSARAVLPRVFDVVQPGSVLDVGCGIGTWLLPATELGATDVAGVDGDYVDRDRLLIPREAFTPWDLEQPLDLGRRFDLVTTLEVAEHLSPAAAGTFVASLVRHADVVLFSAAIPGQGGEHHVNEQWPGYWAQHFAAHGFVACDPLRAACWLDPSVAPWYAQNLLVFVQHDRLDDFPAFAAAAAPGGAPLPLVHPLIFQMAVERAAVPPVPAPAPAMPAPPAGDLRSFVTVVDAAEAAEDPDLLRAYAGCFTAFDDATLVLYAPDGTPDGLGDAIASAGLDAETGPDALLITVAADETLGARAAALLTRRDPRPELAGVPAVGPGATLLLRALSRGEVPLPARDDGVGAAVFAAVLEAAGGPDLTDNVDLIRFEHGLGAPSPADAPKLLARLLPVLPAFDPLYDRLDAASREVLVSLFAFRVLGHRKVALPVGPFSSLASSAEQIRTAMLREEGTAQIDFLGWTLDRYDLSPIGTPIELHSHPWLIINEFLLEQYRAPEPTPVSVREGDVVVDGGGCWGETSLHFAHLAGPSGRVETFEFDPANLETLERNLDLNPELRERIHLNRHPLWHTAGETLSFTSNGPGTRLGSGEGGVTTATIDDLVATGQVDRVDFVKLDIEGAELAALQGAEQTLRAFRPRLAIAAYHRDDDLVALPAFLEGLGVGYRFALGHYTMALEETVLFAWVDQD